MMIRKLERNLAGRDWVVGDVHGCFKQMSRLLEIIAFDPGCDRLFSVGDLVDRGEDSPAALNWLSEPWFFAVRGNHEQMALDALRQPQESLERHLRNGGAWLTEQTPANRAAIDAAFDALPLAIQIELECGRAGIVHGDCPDNDWDALAAKLESGELSDEERRFVLWSRERAHHGGAGVVRGVDLLLVGHTPQTAARLIDNVMYLDTGAVYGDKLTLFCLNDFVEVSLPSAAAPLAHFQLH